MERRSHFKSRWLKVSEHGRRFKPSVLVVVVVVLCASVLVPLAGDPPLLEPAEAHPSSGCGGSGALHELCEAAAACTTSGGSWSLEPFGCVYPTTTTTTVAPWLTCKHGYDWERSVCKSAPPATTTTTTTVAPWLTCKHGYDWERSVCKSAPPATTTTTTTVAPWLTCKHGYDWERSVCETAPTTTTTTTAPVRPVSGTCHAHGSDFVNNECHTHPTDKACGETVWVHTGDLSRLHATYTVTSSPPCAPSPCPTGQHRVNGACVSRCSASERWVLTPYPACVSRCATDQRWADGACEPRCKSSERWVKGACEPRCKSSERWVKGACEPRCKSSERWLDTSGLGNGICKPRCGVGQDWFNGACHAPCPTGEYRAQFPDLVTCHAHYSGAHRWGVYVYFGDVHAISAQKQSVNRPYSTVAVGWVSTQSGPGCKAPSNPEHPSGCPRGRYVSGFGLHTVTPVFYCNVLIRSLNVKSRMIRDWTEFVDEFKSGVEAGGDFAVKTVSYLPGSNIINMAACTYTDERNLLGGGISLAKHANEQRNLLKTVRSFFSANAVSFVADAVLTKTYCDALKRSADNNTPTTTTPTSTVPTTTPTVKPPTTAKPALRVSGRSEGVE